MSLQVALIQKSFVVEDLQRNVHTLLDNIRSARHQGADLVVFPELSVTGYPPEDLLLRDDYLDAVEAAVKEIAQSIDDEVHIIIGAPIREDGKLFNAALHITRDGLHAYHKRSLPNYGVFDEKRYFSAGSSCYLWDIKGYRLGITICEDIWNSEVIEDNKAQGAQCIININASPFDTQKQQQRLDILRARYQQTRLPIVYVNLMGAQDELVFDGSSVVINSDGDVGLQAPAFEEGIYLCDPFAPVQETPLAALADIELIDRALRLALARYVDKNRFDGVVLGVSGGIDSAVSLKLAVDALGASRVHAVLMPSPWTAQMSIDDAQSMAQQLGVAIRQIPIAQSMEVLQQDIETSLKESLQPLPLQNLQARIRGCLLMTLANQYRLMVVSTSNKSEVAVGYTTLYGDMVGGYAPLKDLEKTKVYELARYYNRDSEIIPQRILDRPPSAELAPGQKDTDTLPPYALLDAMLKGLVEDDASLQQLSAQGFDPDIVEQVQQMLAASEHKRYQGPPGPKITPRSLGKDRRYPLSYQLGNTRNQ